MFRQATGAASIPMSKARGLTPRFDKMQIIKYSAYAPRLDYTPPEPEWKQMEEFRDALPAPRNSNTKSLDNSGPSGETLSQES
jgi:hypothetical protein